MVKKSPRVLVIDNDKTVRNSLARLLTRNGFLVATSATGNRALHKLRKETVFDCAIVPLVMPDMLGRDFISILVKENLYPLDRVIILTTVHNADNATAYMQFGCAAYCGMPFDNDRMLEQITRVCAGQLKTTDLDALF